MEVKETSFKLRHVSVHLFADRPINLNTKEEERKYPGSHQKQTLLRLLLTLLLTLLHLLLLNLLLFLLQLFLLLFFLRLLPLLLLLLLLVLILKK